MSEIKLNFINQSNDVNNSSVVIFQQNVANDFDELAVAWRVIKNNGHLDHHPFTFPLSYEVSANDSYGNYIPELSSEYGQAFEVTMGKSGQELHLSPIPAASNDEVEVRNNLETGAIDANCYKDGRLLAVKTGVAPQQKATFKFEPKINIGVVSQVEEGEVMNSAILSEIYTQLDLTGIASADIVMTGGGPGASSTPFIFHLENIVYI